MAESKRPSSTKKPATAAEPPVSSKAQGIDPKAVYVGGESLADRLLPHAKKIFLTLGAIAVILTAGASWGAVLLWQIAFAGKFTGVSIQHVNAHGHAQIYGWVGLFIMPSTTRVLP